MKPYLLRRAACLPTMPCLVAAVGLACASAGAVAQGAPENIRHDRTLVAAIHNVMPEYVAGTKFRSPETLDGALAADVAQRLQATLATVPSALPATTPNGVQLQQLLASGKAHLVLATFSGAAPALPSATVIPTGYAAAPMAIMRTDTDIKSWKDLRGRKVCVSGDGRYAGTIATRYGAVEQVYKAPADSLLALRIGTCDAAVHDSALLEALIQLPEWKKFSARLPAGPFRPLSFVVPADDAQTAAILRQSAREWQASGHLQQLTTKLARSIAFEVYLDQDVPDCH